MKRNFLISLTIFLSIAAISSTGALDLWSDLDGTDISYIDNSFPKGKLEITVIKNNSLLDLKISILKKIGSRTSRKFYVAFAEQNSELPLEVTVLRSNKNGTPIGSRSEGTLFIEKGNKEVLVGNILEHDFEAKSSLLE